MIIRKIKKFVLNIFVEVESKYTNTDLGSDSMEKEKQSTQPTTYLHRRRTTRSPLSFCEVVNHNNEGC